MNREDSIYSHAQSSVAPFEFNDKVVQVFDDMITRSVPLYRESLCRQAQLAAHFYQQNSVLYDLGCSNGNFGLQFIEQMRSQSFKMVGIDTSQPMLDQYERRLKKLNHSDDIVLCHQSIEEYPFRATSVVVINLTLQFLSLEVRTQLLQRVYDALLPGGILLLTEKVVHQDHQLSQLQQDWYYRFKKENGYSQLEISQKRDALENVLIPETIEQHETRLRQLGFQQIDVWLKWFNFASLVCVK